MKAIWQFKLVGLLTLLSFNLPAQTDSSWYQKPRLTISAFADVFYVFDFNRPQGTSRQSFLFNHNRHNEFNLNLGLLKFELEQSAYRATIGLQTGTYVNENYAAEPGILKSIFEASIGIALNRKKNLWLDAGVLPSHIGFESAITYENWTMTRSLLAENSPYFLTGAKLSYTPNDKINLAGLIVNGWQRIQRLQGNSLPSFGTQVNFSPTENILLNWSSFIGTDDPDMTRRMRYFNNFYGKIHVTKKFGLITGFDIGIQQRNIHSSVFDFWFSPVIIGQFIINDQWKTAIRGEYYQDKAGVIILKETANGFKTTGLSLNLDYSPTQNIFCRIEGRWLHSKDHIFETRTSLLNNNLIIGTSIAINFSQKIMN